MKSERKLPTRKFSKQLDCRIPTTIVLSEISNLLKWTYYFYVYLKLFSFVPSLSSLSHRISKPENQTRNSFKTHSKKNKSDPKDLFRLCSVQVKQYFRFAITQRRSLNDLTKSTGVIEYTDLSKVGGPWGLNWTVKTTESGRSYMKGLRPVSDGLLEVFLFVQFLSIYNKKLHFRFSHGLRPAVRTSIVDGAPPSANIFHGQSSKFVHAMCGPVLFTVHLCTLVHYVGKNHGPSSNTVHGSSIQYGPYSTRLILWIIWIGDFDNFLVANPHFF